MSARLALGHGVPALVLDLGHLAVRDGGAAAGRGVIGLRGPSVARVCRTAAAAGVGTTVLRTLRRIAATGGHGIAPAGAAVPGGCGRLRTRRVAGLLQRIRRVGVVGLGRELVVGRRG